MGTVRPPSPECAATSSRKGALSRESTVVRSLATSLAGLAAEMPTEETLTSLEVPELSGAFDPSSAVAGSLGGTESVVPLTASEPLPRFGGRLLLVDACAVEKPDAAGTAEEIAPVSTAPAAVVAVGSVPVGVVSEGAGVHSGAFGVHEEGADLPA